MWLAAASSVAWAAPVSTSDIVCGLDPHCTRPLSREFRGVTVTPGPVGTDPLSVNLYVNFAYDSAELTSDARIILDRLGYALVDDRLKEFAFMIEGHTDAHGSVPYNQTLSEQRARTVQRYLIDNFGIAEARLRAQGHGTLVLLSSVAGERVRRSNFVYGSTKAGLDAFYTGLTEALRPYDVGVTVVRPGFVHTRMTEGMKPAPLSTTPEAVASAVVDAVRNRREQVWVPAPLRGVMSVLRHLPRPVFRRLPV